MIPGGIELGVLRKPRTKGRNVIIVKSLFGQEKLPLLRAENFSMLALIA